MPTFAATRHGYQNLWNTAKLLPQHHAAAIDIANKILSAPYRAAFEEVQQRTMMPWYLVGCWLCRESGLNLNTYLGNGEALSKVTHLVPAGRGPFTGPKAFLNGAIDAITFQKLAGIKDWPVAFQLWASEAFNGMGYYKHNVNDPYVWSWTQLYTKGKYVGDGDYDANFVDPQPGVAAILKALAELNPDIAKALSVSIDAATPITPAHEGAAPARAPLSTAAAPAPKKPEVPMNTTTTTAVATAQATDPYPKFIAEIEMAKKYLPFLIGFLPLPYQGLASAVPDIIEEGLKIAEDAKTKGGVNLVDSILARIQNIAGHGRAAITSPTVAVSTGGDAAAAPVKSEGLPNS